MPNLTLYSAIPSRGITVQWLLEELAQPYELKLLDLETQEHKQEAYLAINPMGRVPALVYGEEKHVVTETAAICLYLAEAYPEAGLNVPTESNLRGEFLRWMYFGPVTGEPAIVWQALNCSTNGNDYQPFADIDSVGNTLTTELRGKEFVVGDTFTAADVLVGSLIMWGTQLMPVLPKTPEIMDYWQQLSQRPAWQKIQSSIAG